jgi:putative transposase
LTKRLVERAMEVELTDHLGYEPHREPPGGTGNIRNGSTPKTLVTEHGPVGIRTPRDRDGSFEPQIVRKRQRRFEGFDEKILALYARGMSTRDIEAHLREIYGASVGRDLISRVTDGVMDDVRAWAARPLEDVYPVVFLDAAPATSPWASPSTATATSSGCGSRRPRARSSGCRSSPTSRPAASRTS